MLTFPSGDARYVLVFDAGSSGTRAYAFSYDVTRALETLNSLQPVRAASLLPRKMGVGESIAYLLAT